MEKVKAWWNNLALSEQQLLGVGGVFLLVIFAYFGVWSPIGKAQLNAERALQAQQQTLNYVKQTADKIVSLKQAGGQKSFSGSLSAIVTQSAKRYGLEITRIQPKDKKIQVWMETVPFNSLVAYLSELVQQKGLSLDNVDLVRADTPGFVKVQRIQLSQ